MSRVLALVVLLGLVGAISAQSYKGCYKRKWGTFRTHETSEDMTNQKCVAVCKEEGLPYAGTYETKCGCEGEEKFGRLSPADDESECSSSCGGDVTQKCGERNGRLTVWTTGEEKREMTEVEDVQQETKELEHHHHHHHHHDKKADKKAAEKEHDKKATAEKEHDKKAAEKEHDKKAADKE
ncbi:uncharacterized protein [Branchiostoma lanceolatum]|uniref:uncharacterized protein isoform X2 n=1 Tax=Branchiostoma lanceolatum TaxID=7740 RepID=UPI00345561C7